MLGSFRPLLNRRELSESIRWYPKKRILTDIFLETGGRCGICSRQTWNVETPMPNFDRTVDNRWRQDLVLSQRRVREEEFEDTLPDELEPRLIYVASFRSSQPAGGSLSRTMRRPLP
jgi:hypothetical protein